MNIVVRYFAAAREAVGNEVEAWDVDEGTTLGALWALLRARHPALEHIPVRFAVGQAFADEAYELADTDEVALIPPVSGG